KIQTDSGEFYSEGHHLVPLGENGYDSLSNVVILCPLCHKKLHYWKDREHLKGKITYSQEHIKTLKKLGFEEEANAS
ncbi:MAG: hypothetical protein GTO54_11240, partial [Nitrososphaeria archaeon]|nr:hypothetical protein [Nitrososphaeria archaeon]